MNERRWFLACAIVVLAACGDPDPVTPGDDGGTTDDGGTPPTDGGGPVNPPLAMADTDGDPENGTEAPADFACVGTATAPTGGAAVNTTAHFYDFQTNTTDVAAVPVQIFTNNLVTTGCAAPDCVASTTDASGDTTFSAAAEGWVAYRVPMNDRYFTTIGYNRAVPATADGTIGLPVVATLTVNSILALLRRSRVPTTSVVAGTITDCDGNTVSGAQLRVYQGGSQLPPGAGMMDFFVGYIEGGLPDRAATYTFPDGIYASANVPASTSPTRVELWAVIEEGADPVRVACEAIVAEADAISIISAGPTRNDYPSGHPCE